MAGFSKERSLAGRGRSLATERTHTGSLYPLMNIAVLCSWALLASPLSGAEASSLRPNLLLISIDTLRADRLGCYGHDRNTSPWIDDLATQGTLFEQAFSQSCKTAISHMSLMTGLYPEAHGVTQLDHPHPAPLPEAIPTLASLLAEQGYRTAAVTGGGHMNTLPGFDRGMSRFVTRRRLQGALQSASEIFEDWKRDESPWFFFLHTYEVHDPYFPPEKYADRFADSHYGGSIVSDPSQLQSTQDWKSLHRAFWERVDPQSEADRQHLLDLYDAAIVWTNDCLGQWFGDLAQDGRLDDTLVVLVSDHGEEFLEHGQFLHAQLHREHLHVPLIVRFPKAHPLHSPGRRINTPVELIDVMPSLLEWLEVSTPPSLQGQSMTRLLSAELSTPFGEELRPHSTPGDSPVLMGSWRREGLDTLCIGPWKLMRSLQEDPATRRLYDLSNDPEEQTDVAADRQDIVQRMEAMLNQLLLQSKAHRTRATKSPLPTLELDEETRERLRALGYLEDGP